MESKTGSIYINPVTQERAVVLVTSADSGGELMRAELWVPPGARVAAPHTHPRQSERFEVLEGDPRRIKRLRVRLPEHSVT